jgi:Spy/CpxP family protein refolding chaperone
MYEDVGLSAAQRAAMDSVLDENNKQREALMKTIKPQLDSLRLNTRAQMYRIFTPEQRTKFDMRVREDSLRRDQSRKAREQKKK